MACFVTVEKFNEDLLVQSPVEFAMKPVKPSRDMQIQM